MPVRPQISNTEVFGCLATLFWLCYAGIAYETDQVSVSGADIGSMFQNHIAEM